MADRIIGIDLGTTNSVAAILEGGQPCIVPTAEGRQLCPSIVGFIPSGTRVVGELAKRQIITHPQRTFASIKRFMGTAHKVTVDGRSYTPPEIAAMILQKLRDDVEAYLGEPVNKAVITVPAYFSDAQRQATRDAGRIAGLDVVRMINEPTAAALSYGLNKQNAGTVLVWDLGGGTFDVSILHLQSGAFTVRSTNGDTRLGGDDWDGRLMSYLLRLVRDRHGIDLSQDLYALQRMKDAAEKAKIALSKHDSTTISLPFLTQAGEEPLNLALSLTQQEFEHLTEDLLRRMVEPTERALIDAELGSADLDAVILVGGSTRMPAVQRLVMELLRHKPVIGVNPDEVVALGAAIEGGMLAGELDHITLLDVTPLSLGIETAGGIFTRIIHRNTTVPTSGSRLFTTSRDNQSAVDFHILQGERDLAAHNKSLGRFSLVGIPPVPRGTPLIEVTFDIDVNGLVHVTAKDEVTGASQQVQVIASSGLSEDEIQSMIAEAVLSEEIDKTMLKIIELQAQGNQLLQIVETNLNTALSALAAPDIVRIEQGMDRLRAAVAAGDPAELLAAIDVVRDLAISLIPHETGMGILILGDGPPVFIPQMADDTAEGQVADGVSEE
ncbi:MAG: molecular chaperone DnaK [Armatimonadota bacterium]